MIIGHTAIIADLKKSAGQKSFGHGSIFFGASRAGKRQVALGLAHYFETGEFDVADRKVLQDVLVISPDTEGTIGIDVVREIRHFLSQMPNISPYRTLIIDRGEYLTTQAQNALLKITEEPPAHALIIIVMDDYERLLPTLQSRMQKLYFGVVAAADISGWLTKELGVAKIKVQEISKKSFGLPGLAWAMLFDKKFEERQNAAAQFLKLRGSAQKEFLKDLTAVDETNPFNFDAFLESVAILLVSEEGKKYDAWHRVMKLRRDADNFNLNPRLQLTALAAAISE